jgi:hypothetical protein
MKNWKQKRPMLPRVFDAQNVMNWPLQKLQFGNESHTDSTLHAHSPPELAEMDPDPSGIWTMFMLKYSQFVLPCGQILKFFAARLHN